MYNSYQIYHIQNAYSLFLFFKKITALKVVIGHYTQPKDKTKKQDKVFRVLDFDGMTFD